MTTWRLTYKTIFYYAIPFLLWNGLFWGFFGLREVFVSLDVVSAFYLPGLLKAVICFLFFAMAIKSTYTFYGVYVNVKRVAEKIEDVKAYKYSVGYDGEQDSGKTFTMTYDGIILSEVKYEDLLFEVYHDMPLVDEFEKKNDEFKLALYKAKRESLEFYKNHDDKIPCFVSNYDVTYKDKKNFKLKYNHFVMKKRMPENAVACADEFANMFGNEQRKKANESEDVKNINDANKFASLHRQYLNLTLLSNDQRLGEIFIGFRTTMGKRFHIDDKEERYTPELLLKIRSFFYNRILDKGENNTAKLSKIYDKIDYYVKRIGFLKLYYVNERGVVGNEKKEKDIKVMSLGKDIPFYYKHRGEFMNYPLRDEKL